MICILKFAKGHNSVKSIGGVMVLGLSTSSDNALYWYRSASLVLAPVTIYRTMFIYLLY